MSSAGWTGGQRSVTLLAVVQSLVGRLAPSPTGRLHLGHARTFLLAWWSLRAREGRVILRIEDLDGDRVQPALIDAARADLEWLGLDWDGPPELQSEGIEAIQAAIDELVARGLGYACVCSRADVRAAGSAPHAGEQEQRYPGTCRGRFESVAAAERRSGKPAGVRFRVPSGTVRIEDGFSPPLQSDVQAEVGDFLVSRRNKAPAYQLAVVVDDARQGVSEVLRGADLLPSTARQWHLQRALGLPHPRWIHVPLVTDETGRRLAKRCDDLSLAELRERGVDARAIVEWAADSAGLEVGGRVEARAVTQSFHLGRLPSTPVVLTRARIEALLEARA